MKRAARVSRRSRRKRNGFSRVASESARVCLAAAGKIADAQWDQSGRVEPLLVLGVELPGGGILTAFGEIEAMLADLEQVAPVLAKYARAAERLRRLASADAVLVGAPLVGDPAAGVFARRGRYLPEEDLGDLEELALGETSIGIGGVA